MRCAIYARYSSDLQRAASIDDQVRVCRAFAETRGWTIVAIFSDEAVSGSGMDRPGLLRLIERATNSDAGFEVLLVDDTSRISRDVSDAHRIFAQLRYCGRRAIAVSQGIDTDNQQSEVLVAIHGIVDSLYVKELGFKTHRGLEGRMLKGKSAGGRCFGYRAEACGESEEDGKRLVIHPAEADVVVRIFEMSAAGASLKGIAKQLNAEKVPPPQSRADRERATWCPSAIRAMLYNERYSGRIIWNRTKFVKRPGTNKRVARPRPRSEWRIVDAPDMRIVGEELWGQVQARLASTKQTYARSGEQRSGLLNRAASSPYILTGLLKCGECGANLVVVRFRKGIHPEYGCPQNYSRGACGNGLKQDAREIERMLLAGIERTLLKPNVVEAAFEEFLRQMQAMPEADNGKARRAELSAEIGRLTAAIAATGHSDALFSALADRERELRTLNSQPLSASLGATDAASLRKFFDRKMLDLVGLLAEKDVPTARAELRKHVSEVQMIPNGTHYIAKGVAKMGQAWLVAGTRNVPSVAFLLPMVA